jgi:hypothetical protein
MAYAPETRAKVRAAYIYQRLSLEIAAAQFGVPLRTAQDWKRKAEGGPEDWDKARAATGLSDGNVDDLAQQILNEFLLQFKSTQELITNSDQIGPLEKVQALASLSDALSKMTANLKRLLPEVNRAVVAQEVINLLADFIAAQFPQHLPAFVDVLGPFGKHLATTIQASKRK